MNIALVEYGAGNLPSVEARPHAARRRIAPRVHAGRLASCDALILPGVGHFGALMRSLTERSLVKPLRDAVASGVPLLGICLGLQAMFATSDEAIGDAGLSYSHRKFPHCRRPIVSHTWMESASPRAPSTLLEGVPQDAYFYFAHSYAALDAGEAAVALCDHSASFVAVLEQGNVFATQFHPEKSGLPARRCFRTSCGARARNNEPRAPHHSLPGH